MIYSNKNILSKKIYISTVKYVLLYKHIFWWYRQSCYWPNIVTNHWGRSQSLWCFTNVNLFFNICYRCHFFHKVFQAKECLFSYFDKFTRNIFIKHSNIPVILRVQKIEPECDLGLNIYYFRYEEGKKSFSWFLEISKPDISCCWKHKLFIIVLCENISNYPLKMILGLIWRIIQSL